MPSSNRNPESIITDRFRKLLESKGAHTVKISDQFTRGIPDVLLVTNRVIMVELKVDSTAGTQTVRTYRSLGLSGAQDHHIRQIARRNLMEACVVTDVHKGGRLRLWAPVCPEREGEKYEDYVLIAEGDDDVVKWLFFERP